MRRAGSGRGRTIGGAEAGEGAGEGKAGVGCVLHLSMCSSPLHGGFQRHPPNWEGGTRREHARNHQTEGRHEPIDFFQQSAADARDVCGGAGGIASDGKQTPQEQKRLTRPFPPETTTTTVDYTTTSLVFFNRSYGRSLHVQKKGSFRFLARFRNQRHPLHPIPFLVPHPVRVVIVA